MILVDVRSDKYIITELSSLTLLKDGLPHHQDPAIVTHDTLY